MKKVHALVLRTAGANCDEETVRALEMAGAYKVNLLHINEIKKNKKIILNHDFIIIPGGFSYGDYINAGKIFSNEIKFIFQEELKKFLKKGNFIMGICNGFQVLVKSGILSANNQQTYSLIDNDSKHFECRWIYLRPNNKLFWTNNLPEVISLPIAHGEGKFITKNNRLLRKLQNNNQIAVQYCDKKGDITNSNYPINPNGSTVNIAGIVNKDKQIFGLMPHPERFVYPQQHPFWNKLKENKQQIIPLGLQIYKNAINELNKN